MQGLQSRDLLCVLLRHRVSAGAADRRQDIVKHPPLKLLGSGQTAVCDEPVNVALSDEPGFLCAACGLKGVAKRDPLAMLGKCVFRVRVPKRRCNISAAEQHFAVLFHGADAAEVGALENL